MSTPTFKTTSRFVTRILDRTATPVYLVSNEYVVNYANQACAQWVGVDLEQLIGAKCVFASQSQGNDLQDRLQGLCPPPSLFEAEINPEQSPQEQPNRRLAVSTIDKNQNAVWRTASISRVLAQNQDDGLTGVLVICGDVVEPEKLDVIAHADPTRLHDALTQIRTRTDRIYCLESLVGVSAYANRMRRQAETAIRSDVDLLIHGPRGTGKEHLARTIHTARDRSDNSARSDLLPVHCSIADQQLIQQNIKDFVTNRTAGGFSGNDQVQDWLLLLDVDRLGEAGQSELLGFIQLPDFPLRTIATSNQSLTKLAEQGSYSKELAFHLSTMTIQLPALSDRQRDIPLLAQALLERDNFQRDRQLSEFSKPALEMLAEFNWPENIDQLNQTILAAAANTSNSQIDQADLPDEFHGALSAMRIGTATETSIQLDSYLAGIEKQLVDRALKQAKGNKTKASKLLGISRPKLLRRVQYFELESTSPDFSEIVEQIEETDTPSSEKS